MTKSDERNIFLKRLANIYAQNPDLPITKSSIYYELRSFNVHNNKNEKIANTSLINVQLNLNEKYKNDERVNTFTFGKGYFWAIENREQLSDEEFYGKIEKAIKLYVSVDSKDMYMVASSLFDFIIKEKIITQSKIAKEMRNDALVLRVSTKEEALKIINFLNEKFEYKSRVKPNPFLFDNGKVSIAMDGRLSYNSTLSKLLQFYYQEKRINDTLDKVDENDFLAFLNKESLSFKNGYNEEYLLKYGLDTSKKILDFMLILNLISSNISGNLNMKNIFSYQKVFEDIKDFDTSAMKINLLYVMNTLNGKYGKDMMHRIINRYIESGDIKLFTRENNIRGIVLQNLNPSILEKLLNEMSYSALIDASIETEKKYGIEQLNYAITKLLSDHKIDGFTNTNDVRSYLGFISNYKIIDSALREKLREKEYDYDLSTICSMIYEEIEKNKAKNQVR